MKRIAVILAGGQSRRFGTDKLWTPYQGKPLIQIAIDTLQSARFDIVISGPKQKFSHLGFPIVEDEQPFEGPLRALQTIFKNVECPRLLLMAADMPHLTAEILNFIWESDWDADCIAFSCEKGVSPLPGIYHRRCQTVIDSALSQDRHDLKILFQKPLQYKIIPENQRHHLDLNCNAFTNVNYQKDLDQSCFIYP